MNKDYTSKNIQVLKGLQAVRIRPSMYIGDTDKKGLHHLIWEITDNSFDEAIAGYCKNIEITLHADGETLSVEDDGRGIPVDTHPTEGKSSLEVVMTTLHAGGKMTSEESGYMVSGGLHGVGASCVNALSDTMTVDVYRDGYLWQQTYSKGVPTSEVIQVKKLLRADKQNGTCVTWHADKEIFKRGVKIDEKEIVRKMREAAFLNKGLSITFINKVTNTKQNFKFDGGIKDYVLYLSENKNGIYPASPIYAAKKENKIDVEYSILWNDSDDEVLQSYANNINTIDGGTHLSGFKTSLTRTINKLGREKQFLKEKDDNLDGRDIQEGICCVVSIKLSQPEFVGQTKAKLGTVEAEGAVSTVVASTLLDYFEKNEKDLAKIIQRAQISQRARKAAKDASAAFKKKSFLGQSGRIPEKLRDCRSDDLSQTELWIVEGASAAGSSCSGRDSEYQAVLALKGKIINAEKCTITDLLKNEEISNIMIAIGTGIKDDFDINKLRYGKIIINCIHGDTKIRTLDGRHPTIKQLQEENNPVWIWTRNGNDIVPILANPPQKTSIRNTTAIITFDDGSVVKTTPDHKFMVNSPDKNDSRIIWKKSGSVDLPYIMAKDLKSSDSICHVIFDEQPLNNNFPLKYDTIKFSGKSKLNRTTFIHRYVNEIINNQTVEKYKNIHHKDKNHKNNVPDNLVYISPKEHIEKHFDPVSHSEIIGSYHKEGIYKGTSHFIKYNKTAEHSENIKNAYKKGSYSHIEKFKNFNGTLKQKEILKENWKNGIYGSKEYRDKLSSSIKTTYTKNPVLVDNIKLRTRNQWTNSDSKFRIATGRGFKIIDKVILNETIQVEDLTDALFDKYRTKNSPRYSVFIKNFESFEHLCREYLKSRNLNKRVVNIQLVEGEEQFYCFTIPETGNFVLANGEIISNCDADFDGAHIATLLLAFFYKYMRSLIDNGNVYIANAPLYMVESKPPVYCWNKEELDKILNGKKIDVKRFKGLGEMNADQLYETTMKKGSRKITQVSISDAIEADRMMNVLMGNNIAERKKHIQKNLKV